jgi:hypothetical protein
MDLDRTKSDEDAFGEAADPIQLCSAFIQRASLDSPGRSIVVEMPARGKLGHPVVVTEPMPYLDAVRDWLAVESSVRMNGRN